MVFVKGQSGNPLGSLPKKKRIQPEIDRLVELPIDKIRKIANDPKSPAKTVIAARTILEKMLTVELLNRVDGKVRDEGEYTFNIPTPIYGGQSKKV